MSLETIGLCALAALAGAVVIALCAVIVSIGACVAVMLYRQATKGGRDGGRDIHAPRRR